MAVRPDGCDSPVDLAQKQLRVGADLRAIEPVGDDPCLLGPAQLGRGEVLFRLRKDDPKVDVRQARTSSTRERYEIFACPGPDFRLSKIAAISGEAADLHNQVNLDRRRCVPTDRHGILQHSPA
jgi:hypothetical protein